MNNLDPQANSPEEIISCYLIINGPLGMSAGKIASQSAQAMLSLAEAYRLGAGTEEQRANYKKWLQGTRTITRIAETESIFERACKDLPGYTFYDAGYTEIEAGPTIHISWPIPRKPGHKITRHKKCPLLTGQPIFNRKG
jgi:peptidyl-tRNA hydrolase